MVWLIGDVILLSLIDIRIGTFGGRVRRIAFPRPMEDQALGELKVCVN